MTGRWSLGSCVDTTYLFPFGFPKRREASIAITAFPLRNRIANLLEHFFGLS